MARNMFIDDLFHVVIFVDDITCGVSARDNWKRFSRTLIHVTTADSLIRVGYFCTTHSFLYAHRLLFLENRAIELHCSPAQLGLCTCQTLKRRLLTVFVGNHDSTYYS